MTRGWWQLIAIVSLAVNSLTVLALVYVAFAFKSNLATIAEASPICLVPGKSLDSIASAQMLGRLDLVSMMVGMGGMMLALSAFIGFWVIRREVLDQATRVAADEVRRVAERYYAENPPTGVRNRRSQFSLFDYIGKRLRSSAQPKEDGGTIDPSSVSVAGAIEEGGQR